MSESDLVERLRERPVPPSIPGINGLDRLNVDGGSVLACDVAEFLENRELSIIPWVDRYEAAAEIERLRAATQWQPIETAPDKESVLVFIPNTEHYGPGIYRGLKGTFGQWMTNAVAMGRDCGTRSQPTHWMPLPSPPLSEGVKDD